MKFSTANRRDSYSLARSRAKRDGSNVGNPQGQPSPDTGQQPLNVSVKGGCSDLFELLERAQSNRLDDQRCVLPSYFTTHQSCRDDVSCNGGVNLVGSDDNSCGSSTNNNSGSSRQMLEAILRGPAPYPMVVLPPRGGYWLDHGDSSTNNGTNTAEAKAYRTHFMGREHSNFVGCDERLGPVLVSVKAESQDQTRVIVRMRTGTHHELLPCSPNTSPYHLAKLVKDDLRLVGVQAIVSPKASQLIAAYDEHQLVSNFKFGVLYQKFAQTSEEQLFSNRHSSPALDEFLSVLGQRINLKYHKGYRGGLDTTHGHTGEEAVYQIYKEREIIFHVSTLLPYTDSDPQQLQRKRHIGNDIVAIVFQETNTPFSPDMIASHFLHAFIVVQAIEPNTPNVRYKVSVTAREDVPPFGPSLPEPAVFTKGPQLREFLLNKLMNAELAAYKANKFAQLELRTRSTLLQTLCCELRDKSREWLDSGEVNGTNGSSNGAGSKFIDTVRKALIARVKSQENNKKQDHHIVPPTTPSQDSHSTSRVNVKTIKKGSQPSSPISSPAEILIQRTPRGSESECSSLNSVELDTGAYVDSDTGLESMSSSEAANTNGNNGNIVNGTNKALIGQCSVCSDTDAQAALTSQITRLKCDKLDLLRQNVNCQREIKRLREKELSLQSELASASKEILRLRQMLKDYASSSSSSPEQSPI